jgi:hypothetical protein
MRTRGTIDGDLNLVNVTKPTDSNWTFGDVIRQQVSASDWVLILLDLVAPALVTEQDPGDTDGNRIVNDLDLANFQAAFGLSGAELIAAGFDFDPDFDDDGDADLDDFVTLRQFFGTNFAPSAPDFAATTPEPATISLLTIGGLAILRRRRRK